MTRRRVAIIGLSFVAGILAGWALVGILQQQYGADWWPWSLGVVIMVVVIVAGLGLWAWR